MSTIRVGKSVRRAERAQAAKALQSLDLFILDLKAAVIAAEHIGSRSVPTSKLREILDRHQANLEGFDMARLRRPTRILGGLAALRQPAPQESAQRREITDIDVAQLIDQVAFSGSYEDAHGSLVVAPRDRIAAAKTWQTAKDTMPDAERDDFWQWAYEQTDVSINGYLAAHLQPGIVRRQAG